ncbi:acyl-CoA thioesterase [Clostridium formicaceticum]|uniref:Acyl-CoA thioester hydrolase YbgC n=2 Tax=Clostridium formicaceticum TaxID=1497 RepID=A0AAC9RQ02_9CLOT|nr:thioesterase family protein [Clostridium formicaceticum]ARE89140.1 Acyl-CoA thioester hydrolase YbgC [Clostridium formicaceticum]
MRESYSEIQVRYQETDQMAVVYHGNYFTWFEVGRTTLLRDMGYSYKQLEQENIMLPVVEVKCIYKEPAKYDDEIVIETKVREMKGIRITFEYNIIRKKDERLLATGETTHAFVDTNLKPINFKKTHPAIYEALIKNS